MKRARRSGLVGSWSASVAACLLAVGATCAGACSDDDDPGRAGSQASSGQPTPEGTSPGPVLVPAPRRFVERALFGTSPARNLVLDPEFDPNARVWQAHDGLGAPAPTSRKVFPRAPTDQPVLRVDTTAPGTDFVVGYVGAHSGPLAASVWLGHAVEADAAAISASREVVVLAADPESPTQDVEHVLTPEGEPQEMEGIRWQAYAGKVEPGSLGLMLMAVVDDSNQILHMTGPVVVGMDEAMRADARTTWREAARRPPRPELARATRAARGDPTPAQPDASRRRQLSALLKGKR